MSKIERGKANVALDGISRLAEALGVEPKVLFEASSRAGLANQRERQVQVPFAAVSAHQEPHLFDREEAVFENRGSAH
jgi:transcriptional regulator with XRE-family HTH domain